MSNLIDRVCCKCGQADPDYIGSKCGCVTHKGCIRRRGCVVKLAALLLTYDLWGDHEYHGEKWTMTEDERKTAHDLRAILGRPHDGDCVKQAQLCMRCLAEEAMAKARWLTKEMRS